MGRAYAVIVEAQDNDKQSEAPLWRTVVPMQGNTPDLLCKDTKYYRKNLKLRRNFIKLCRSFIKLWLNFIKLRHSFKNMERFFPFYMPL